MHVEHGIKAYIDCDTLMKIIRDKTILTKRKDIPEGWRWFQMSDGSIVSWQFATLDKVLVDVELAPDWINRKD